MFQGTSYRLLREIPEKRSSVLKPRGEKRVATYGAGRTTFQVTGTPRAEALKHEDAWQMEDTGSSKSTAGEGAVGSEVSGWDRALRATVRDSAASGPPLLGTLDGTQS